MVRMVMFIVNYHQSAICAMVGVSCAVVQIFHGFLKGFPFFFFFIFPFFSKNETHCHQGLEHDECQVRIWTQPPFPKTHLLRH